VTGARSVAHLPPSDRMVAFTDAAVAIALTLLVLPLVDIVPDAARAGEPATAVITDNLAPIGSFLLSFAVIAQFWSAHHRLYGYEHRLTPALVQLNLLWVLTIAVLPFPTEMLATFKAREFVVAFYLAVLLICSASLTTMTIIMRRTAVADGKDDGVPESFVVGSLASTATMVVALVVVLAAPSVGPWALLILIADRLVEPLVRRLRGDSADRAERRTGPA
jgi:uncharacterized membrane protein